MAKVLLVEDDPSIIQMYTLKLKQKHEVLEASTGKAGLELAIKEKPDIILLDVIIPQMDGFAVLEELKKNPATKKIPVVLLTNLGQESDKEKGEALGAAGYLVKANFTPSQVLETIEGFLKKKSSS
jgi:CheY-like chemotaxis protein